MKTRKQYMNGEVSHREYNAQFVDDQIKKEVLDFIGLDKLMDSKDEHLNDISCSQYWDKLAGFEFRGSEMVRKPVFIRPELMAKLKETGEGLSCAGLVCIYKEAAKQIIEENTEREGKNGLE